MCQETVGFCESSQPFLLAQKGFYFLLRSVIDSPGWGDDRYHPSVLLLIAAFPIVPHGFGKREYLYLYISEYSHDPARSLFTLKIRACVLSWEAGEAANIA